MLGRVPDIGNLPPQSIGDPPGQPSVSGTVPDIGNLSPPSFSDPPGQLSVSGTVPDIRNLSPPSIGDPPGQPSVSGTLPDIGNLSPPSIGDPPGQPSVSGTVPDIGKLVPDLGNLCDSLLTASISSPERDLLNLLSPSTDDVGLSGQAFILRKLVSPSDIVPIPQLTSRPTTLAGKGRRTQPAAILTSSPYRNDLRARKAGQPKSQKGKASKRKLTYQATGVGEADYTVKKPAHLKGTRPKKKKSN